MKTLNIFAVALVSATVATAAFAKGPGSGMGGGQGQMTGTGQKQGQGQGTQKRDPASNPTGQPAQQRDRIHTPGTGMATVPSLTTN